MKTVKRMLNLVIAAVMLLTCFHFPLAAAADDPAVVTLNVTNTPIRGEITLEKTGMQLVRFVDEKDSYGNTVMKRSSARKARCSTRKTSWWKH